MNLYYWLYLFGFVSLLTVSGFLKNSLNIAPSFDAVSLCDQNHSSILSSPHPFLCGKKISIRSANIAELSSVKGISKAKARLIYSFFKTYPHKTIDQITIVRGIGKQTLERLQEKFF